MYEESYKPEETFQQNLVEDKKFGQRIWKGKQKDSEAFINIFFTEIKVCEKLKNIDKFSHKLFLIF